MRKICYKSGIIKTITILSLVLLPGKVFADMEKQVWVGDFEHGPMSLTRENSSSPWYRSGNLAEVVTSPVRKGAYAARFFVDRLHSENSYRTMITPKDTPFKWAVYQDIGKEWWYGFSMYFPASWTEDPIWDLVAQMHARRDGYLGELARNPFLGWYTTGDNIRIHSRWDSKINTWESGEKVYSGSNELWRGPIDREQWTDWVMNAKWSYEDDGFIKIWMNGVLIVDSKGPNCYNDEEGVYFNIGAYKGWGDRFNPPGLVSTRLVYFDEVRIAGGNAAYCDVAPNRPCSDSPPLITFITLQK